MPPLLALIILFVHSASLWALPLENLLSVTNNVGFIFNNSDIKTFSVNITAFLPKENNASYNVKEIDSWRIPQNNHNSWRLQDSWRALRSREVVLGQYPYVAHITSILVDDTVIYCAGAILSSIYVATSAQCVYKAVSIQVSAGSLYVGEGQVSNAWPIIHPGFRRLSLINDIAMVRLLQGFIYGSSLLPIKLPRSAGILSENAMDKYAVNIFGWPFADDGSRNSLSQVMMTLLTRTSCNVKMREVWAEYTTTHSCVDTDYLTKTLCIGDRGSPVTFTFERDPYPSLVGIVSDLASCPSDYPFAFTRIAPYMRWIKLVMTE